MSLPQIDHERIAPQAEASNAPARRLNIRAHAEEVLRNAEALAASLDEQAARQKLCAALQQWLGLRVDPAEVSVQADGLAHVTLDGVTFGYFNSSTPRRPFLGVCGNCVKCRACLIPLTTDTNGWLGLGKTLRYLGTDPLPAPVCRACADGREGNA